MIGDADGGGGGEGVGGLIRSVLSSHIEAR